MTLRVGVDATCWLNRRGFGRFTRNVLPRLIEGDPGNEYVLYVDAETAREASLPTRATKRVVELSEPPTQAAAAGSTRRIRDLLRLARAVRADRPDSFLFPSVYTYFPVLGTPTVLGVHDAIARELPGLTLATARDRLAWRAKEALAVRTATSVFTVSRAARAALAEQFGLDPEGVRVVPEAPDDVFRPRTQGEVEAARAAVGLAPHEGFLVFAGGVSPHKNVETLLRALALLRAERRSTPRLVVVGDLERDAYLSSAASVRAVIAELGLEGAVLLPGYVPDEQLAGLYGGAAAVVIPSLAEGFGLPAVEGAACGAPMVLSDLPAHRETLNGGARFFPATDAGALASELRALLDDREGALELAARGLALASALSWDAAVEPLRELVVEAARRRRNGRG
jgi:glycosyltransferase involved in cell wall biosynthesis